MTDVEMVDESRVKEAISELQGQSDIHLPVFATSAVTGGAGLLMTAHGEAVDDQRLVNAGFGVTGAAAGLSLAEVAAMAHHMLIEDRNGSRAFLFHHDAAGLLAIGLGAAAFAFDSVPDEFGTFLIGLGIGAIVHHVITELSLHFVEPQEDTLEEEVNRAREATVEEKEYYR